MVKVDFLFYQEEYAGTIIPDATSLKQPLLKANLYLSQMLCEDGEGSAEELVKLCLCEVAELLYQDSIIRQGSDTKLQRVMEYRTIDTKNKDLSKREREFYSAMQRYFALERKISEMPDRVKRIEEALLKGEDISGLL